jgi:hypothetical protein
MTWIDAAERKPEECVTVLMSHKGYVDVEGHVGVGFVGLGFYEDFLWYDSNKLTCDPPTHWMPMPDPYNRNQTDLVADLVAAAKAVDKWLVKACFSNKAIDKLRTAIAAAEQFLKGTR